MTANSYWATKPLLYTMRLKKEHTQNWHSEYGSDWSVWLQSGSPTCCKRRPTAFLGSTHLKWQNRTHRNITYTQHRHVRTFFRDVTPDGLVYSYRRLWRQQCLHLAGKARPCLKLFTSSHGVTSQKTKIFINAAAWISNLSNWYSFAALQRDKPRIDSTGLDSVGVTYGALARAQCVAYTQVDCMVLIYRLWDLSPF